MQLTSLGKKLYSLSVVCEQLSEGTIEKVRNRTGPEEVPRLMLLLDETAAGEARYVQ